jgi:hypothetical protein
MMAVLGCSIARAQISYSNSLVGATLIYSNAFNGSAVNITNTAPNYAATLFGGSNNAVWYDALGTNDTNALLANGVLTTIMPDSWELPFVPQSNHVYTLTATLTFTGNPGNWIGLGFAQRIPINATNGYGRLSDGGTTPPQEGPNGYDWMILTESTENLQYFQGAGGASPVFGGNNFFSPATGAHTGKVILDTTSNRWVIAGFVDGNQAGTNRTLTSNPTIGALGITQNILNSGGQSDYQWNSFTLSAAQLIIDREPASATLGAGAAYTNIVQAAGTPPFYYQWYTNGVAVGSATNGTYILNPVTPQENGVTFQAVVTNSAFGAVTSSVASLTVYTTPSFVSQIPISYTNPIILFGGTNSDGTNFVGSTPTFSTSAVGGYPLVYQWYTNGVAMGAATNGSITFTNCQLYSPTNFTLIVTNSYGSITDTVSAVYVPAPEAQYPQTVLALQPASFWRMNEQPDNNNGDDGTIGNDYESGNNGLYTNVVLAQTGYNSAETSETSVMFGNGGNDNSFLGAIEGLDFAAPAGSNGEFSVDAWVNGEAADPGAAIISQGAYGTSDSYLLGADTNSSDRKFWFYVRSANGTVYRADSSVSADDGNWHNVVGVCDEANSNLSLYVDGKLVSSILIPTNSGVFEAAAPTAIGAGTQNNGSGYNNQFFGYIDDVAAYKYALNSAEVSEIFGGPVAVGLIPPLPPSNGVYITGQTLTVPAFAFGAPPMRYYWTNLTAGGIIASGKTNVLKNLNATLIISNAPASLSGDQVELVITNAYGSTNWTVTLFSPPPPVTLGYTNEVYYSNDFDGGTWPINGMALTAANILVGGTNTTWTDALGTNDNGSMPASGLDGSLSQDSWELPFTPEPGYIYTVTAQVTFNAALPSGDWVGAGFAERVVTNAAVGYGRFSDGGTTPPDQGPEGYDWLLLQYTGNVQDFAGPGGQNQLTSTTLYTGGTGTHTAEVVLNTTGSQWVMSGYVDGVQAGSTYTYTSGNPPIGAVGITQTTLNNPNAVQWDSFMLTQVAPGGVPPYLLAPLPGSVSLTNTTISIPATAYGSAPLGYSWTFNNNVLASGLTNNLSPINANLSVPSSSLGSGQLQLTVTNTYGTNITLVSLVSPVNTNADFPIGITYSNNNVYLTWPLDHEGWQLQAQTNSVSVGISTNWVNVSGTTGTNEVVFPMNLSNGTVFYRLTLAP